MSFVSFITLKSVLIWLAAGLLSRFLIWARDEMEEREGYHNFWLRSESTKANWLFSIAMVLLGWFSLFIAVLAILRDLRHLLGFLLKLVRQLLKRKERPTFAKLLPPAKRAKQTPAKVPVK